MIIVITFSSNYSLQAYKYLAPLRLLVCGGDGSVGWVLKEIDKLHLKVIFYHLMCIRVFSTKVL